MYSCTQRKISIKLLALIAMAALALALIAGYGLSQKATADEPQAESDAAATLVEPASEDAPVEEAVAAEAPAEEAVAEEAALEDKAAEEAKPEESILGAGEVSNFEDFEAALEASGNATIKLGANIEMGDQVVVGTGTKTLDLNGHKIACKMNVTMGGGLDKNFDISGGAQLTITNSNTTTKGIIFTEGDMEALAVSGTNSKLTLEKNVQVSLGETVPTQSINDSVETISCLISVDQGTLTIKDGSYYSGECSVIIADEATVNISGGNFLCDYEPALRSGYSTVNISGGTISTNNGATTNLYRSNVNITGGTFKSLWPEEVNQVEGFSPDTALYFNTGTTATVSNATCIAENWAHAFYVCGANVTINSGQFISDKSQAVFVKSEVELGVGQVPSVEEEPAVSWGVLNIKGGTFKSGSNAVLDISGAKVTIDDGYFKTDAGNAVRVTADSANSLEGTLTINGGTFIGANTEYSNNSAIYASYTTNLTITGGDFKMGGHTLDRTYMPSLTVVDTAKKVEISGGNFYTGIFIDTPLPPVSVDEEVVDDVFVYTNLDQLLADGKEYLVLSESGVAGERYTAVDTSTAKTTSDSICVGVYSPTPVPTPDQGGVAKTGDSLIAVYAALGMLMAAAGALVLARARRGKEF